MNNTKRIATVELSGPLKTATSRPRARVQVIKQYFEAVAVPYHPH